MAKAQTILVTGAGGQLGMEFQQLASTYPQYHFIFRNREELPIDDGKKLRELFSTQSIDYCINCAAYTAVDKAETEREAAFNINARSVGILAAICKEFECRFIHISTDYVFNGKGTKPYKEDDPTGPAGVYGATKLEGEQQAIRQNPSSIIIRTSWVYSSFGKNFVKTMLRLMAEKEELKVVNDQKGSPTYALDIAKAIMQVISKEKWVEGVYHFSNQGEITWYEFAEAIKEMAGMKCRVMPITTDQYPTPAVRPAYSVLDNTCIINTFHIKPVPWKTSLADCLKLLKKDFQA